MGDTSAACGPGRARALPRRTALALGLAALAAPLVSGCTPTDPRVDSSTPSRAPHPTSSPSAARPTDAADGELALAAWADAVRTGAHRAGLTAVQRPVLQRLAATHREHAAALRPTGTPSTGGPTAGGSATPTTRPTPARAPLPAGFARLSLAQSLDRLRRDEQTQAARLRASALVGTGADALLLGSASVSDAALAAALTAPGPVPPTPPNGTPAPVAAVSDVAAVQAMVRQLHAVVYGYQLALGHLAESSAAGRRALASLHQHRALRDRLEAELVERSAGVPVAYAAYVPSVQPSTAARSARLIRTMETALQPFCGQWLASATQAADRAAALAALGGAVATSRAWGSAPPVWPGWPS